MMRALVFAAVALCSGPASAQVAPKQPTPVTSAQPVQVNLPAPQAAEDETVIVQGYRDRAMNAYLRGDFEAAEREFGENLSCIERVETLRSFAFEQAQMDTLRSETDLGGLPTGPAAATTTPTASYGIHRRRARVPERTCSSPYWQHYMMGMSQIGRGRFGEAKQTLYRVVRESNEPYLFDAHYRVGLLEVLDGNLDEADRRLTHLRRMQRHCIRRGESCDIGGELEDAVTQLETTINAARRSVRRRQP